MFLCYNFRCINYLQPIPSSKLEKSRPFFKQKKPTPYDEAVSLSWYLENVFYYSVSNIFKYVKSNIFDNKYDYYDLISVGFWPGGDRDGNPFVTKKITDQSLKIYSKQTITYKCMT